MTKQHLEQCRAVEITRLHNEIVGLIRTGLDRAIRIGELLTEQKANTRHGQWADWVAGNLPFTARTASNYMLLYHNRDRLKSESVSDLAEAYDILRRPQLPTGLELLVSALMMSGAFRSGSARPAAVPDDWSYDRAVERHTAAWEQWGSEVHEIARELRRAQDNLSDAKFQQYCTAVGLTCEQASLIMGGGPYK